jgi:hypothetical protein
MDILPDFTGVLSIPGYSKNSCMLKIVKYQDGTKGVLTQNYRSKLFKSYLTSSVCCGTWLAAKSAKNKK